ncbi:hypothetical protein FRC07_009148 [Ceratobasidium sp. 392]|nr:hypothetical protein FRC07_009148 [Ceratobasidium sp. 392]
MIPSSIRAAASNIAFNVLHYATSEEKAAIDEYYKRTIISSLAAIQPLVSFTTSTDVLDCSCVDVISNWPLLERLEITVLPCEDYIFPELAESAFPRLKHLALHRLPNSAVFNMFWSASALVGKLESVKLIVLFDFFDINVDTGDFVIDPWSLLISLVEKSPRLRHVWLRIFDRTAERPLLVASVLVFDVLNQLPLRTIHLEGVCLNSGDEIEHLIEVFPMLEELGLPSHRIRFTDLVEFQTKIPKLRTLRIGVELESLKLDLVPRRIAHCRQSQLRTLELNFFRRGHFGINTVTVDECTFPGARALTL